MDERAVDDAGDARAGANVDPALDAHMKVVCRQVVELVTDYLEGALPVDLRAAVERHLELCPPCVVYVEQMRTTAAALREVPVESIDPVIRAELVSAFRDLIPKSGDRGALTPAVAVRQGTGDPRPDRGGGDDDHPDP